MFLSGAMLISVAMLGAALYSSITNKEEREKVNPDLPSGEAVYEMALSLIASNFSVFPVMLLYALVKHDGHRKWLHRAVLFILWGLSASVVYMAPRAEVDYAERKSGHANFDCDQRGSQYWHVVKATQFLVIGLPLLWLIITIFLTTGFKIPGLVDKPWVKTWRSIWRLLIAWINLFLMWGILAYFTHFRQKIIDAAGGLDKNDKWTFGQVLALAAWVPVVAELFYILACKYSPIDLRNHRMLMLLQLAWKTVCQGICPQIITLRLSETLSRLTQVRRGLYFIGTRPTICDMPQSTAKRRCTISNKLRQMPHRLQHSLLHQHQHLRLKWHGTTRTINHFNSNTQQMHKDIRAGTRITILGGRRTLRRSHTCF